MSRLALVALFLAAIVAANLSAEHWGPQASIYNAFAFIGLDLTLRDRLHDALGGRRLALAAVVAAGALVSWLVNRDAGDVAVASCVAFAAAFTIDAVVYELLHRRPWLERANASNVPAAAADSLIFPTLAFGGLVWFVTFAQFCAKVAGGLVWSLVLAHRRR